MDEQIAVIVESYDGQGNSDITFSFKSDLEEAINNFPNQDFGTILAELEGEEILKFIEYLFSLGIKDPCYVETAAEMYEEFVDTHDDIIFFNHQDKINREQIISYINDNMRKSK